MSRLYVGNLPFTATEDDVRRFFDEFHVTSVKFIHDHDTGRPRGFAFVDVQEDAQTAIAQLDGTDLGGRTVRVSEAIQKPRSGAPRNGGPPRNDHGGRGRDDRGRRRRDEYED